MIEYKARVIGAAVVSLIAAACMHVPVSTMAELWSFDAAKADPAAVRAAVRLPEVLVPRPGGVVLTLSISGGSTPEPHEFVLEEAREPMEIAAIAHEQRPGTGLYAYRLSKADAERVRNLQRASMAASGRGGTIAVGAKACRRGPLPAGPVVTSTYLQLDRRKGYMPLIVDIDLRSELGAAGLDKEIPPCP
jgi:hypothetical protein